MWLIDIYIDIYLFVLLLEINESYCLVLLCSWFFKKFFFILNEIIKEWNKNYVLIFVNIYIRYLVLIVLFMKKNCIGYFDLFGGFDDEIIFKIL